MADKIVYMIPSIFIVWSLISIFIVRKRIKALPQNPKYKRAIKRMLEAQ